MWRKKRDDDEYEVGSEILERSKIQKPDEAASLSGFLLSRMMASGPEKNMVQDY
jgi:hypothetical protein